MSEVVGLRGVDRSQVALVGGKAAQLGELVRIGVDVPDGFCVTTGAYQRVVEADPAIEALVARLAGLDPGRAGEIREQSAAIRRVIEAIALPDDLVGEVTGALAALDPAGLVAVRSSATAEDLPGASSAGQHDSHLDVPGAAVLEHLRRCWASLFTERAVTYRLRHGIDHGEARMAAIVQEMVHPRAAGVLFTADPVTSDRTICVVEAVPGLADALVSGRADPDSYRVRGGEVVARTKSCDQPTLDDSEVVELSQLGRRIEAHLGQPQDIEWCLADGGFRVVQSRPITTLYPIPVADDDAFHVYVSVGHQQMMTDPMKPLGISVWQLTAGPPMHEAGSRLFVDVTDRLASPATRQSLLDVMGRGDPLVRDALEHVLDHVELVPMADGTAPPAPRPADASELIEADPRLVAELISENEASVASLERDIRSHTGPGLFDFIRADIVELKRLLFDPGSMSVIVAGMGASQWLDANLEEWLGVRGATDALTRSAPGNVTSEMGLALLDVADAIRPHPEVVAHLRNAEDDGFLEDLPGLEGGAAAADAIRSYLDEYGARCVGEIDITRPRWRERPSMLLPAILSHVDTFEAGERARRVDAGRHEATRAERDLLGRVRGLPDGDARVGQVKQMIDRVRTFIGYREYPKFGLVRRYAVYRQAILAEADRLAGAGVLAGPEDVYFLTLAELQDVARTHRLDRGLVHRRAEAFRSHRALTPPRVLTSDGEARSGSYRRDDVPAGALVGLPVSAGTVEGRARIVLDMARADVSPGDILVTTHTDPSWSPLFVAVAGVVTEVGGQMTHGAVIAREYGLPAVVGVERATQLIRDGQRIRVDGTDGYVQVLSP